MQPVAAQPKRASDIASTVVATMRQLGVAGLPRNYEIFYEALTASNPQLSLEVVSLPQRPTQEELDKIGRKYFAHHHGGTIVEQAREMMASELEEIAGVLRKERSHIERYGAILNESSGTLKNTSGASQTLLEKIAKLMSAATSATLEQSRQTSENLEAKSAELEAVKQSLEQYKRLSETDPLTQLENRRAFDRELIRVYEQRGSVSFQALILADIDHFKLLNDRFGHPVGDKVIQLIAGVLRAHLRANTFVARTGGEEFAIIVEGGTEDTTAAIAERVRRAIEQTSLAPHLGVAHDPLTISLGICTAAQADGPADLYAKADQALYGSKMGGRNCVTRHSAMTAAPSPSPAKEWLIYSRD